MNLYLVFAIALGAISGVVEAPVARPALLVAQGHRRVERGIVHRERTALEVGSPVPDWSDPRPASSGLRPAGCARPRAPALD